MQQNLTLLTDDCLLPEAIPHLPAVLFFHNDSLSYHIRKNRVQKRLCICNLYFFFTEGLACGQSFYCLFQIDQWSGTLKLVFQPAEEGVRGAKSIVAHGHLDDVTVMLGSHVTASNQCNEFDIYAGAGGSLATTKLDVTYTGLASHAAGAPEKGRNVMPAVATAILNLYALPRNSQGETRVNVGVVHAGSGRNIIANNATMLVEIRGANTQINAYMEEYARRILEDAGHMHGVECEINSTPQ